MLYPSPLETDLLHLLTPPLPWPAAQVSPTKELMMQSGRVLKLLLPGLGLRASILTKATAAGTDFGKVGV